MAQGRVSSILESARKAAGREKAYKIFEEKNEGVKSSNTKDTIKESDTSSTERTTSILESARKAAGRERASRTFSSSAPSFLKNDTKKYTDFNTETKNAYTSAKDKVNSKTTITSAMSEDDRKARIKEIKSELNELSKARSGLSRAKLYGNVDDMIASNNARTSELTKELKELESYKTPAASDTANGWEIAGNSAMSGLGTFNKGLFSTLDFILPTEFLGEYDFVSNLNDYYSNQDAYWKQQKEESVKDKSTATKILADIGEGTVAALPNAILAVMSGGSSAAGTALGTAPASTGFFSTIGNTASTMAKNPMYWTSFAQTVGTDYEEAKANGANEFVATATAIIKSGINAGIEIGGGIETLPDNLKSGDTKLITQWVKSMVEEGNEEVVQGIVSGVVDKAMYDRNKKIVSFSDENAIVNPQRMAKEFGMGAAVGGVLGGGQIGSVSVANNILSHYAKNAKTVEAQNAYADSIIKDEKALKALIEEGKASGDGTVLAEVANEIETAIANGEEVTREQVKRLIQSSEVYIKEEETTEADTLEKAAQDVVEKRNKPASPVKRKMSGYEILEARKSGVVTAELLDALTEADVEITTEEVKKVSGLGDKGAELVANKANVNGVTFTQALEEVKPSYLDGYTQTKDRANTKSENAYTAGEMDRIADDDAQRKFGKSATIYNGEIVENEFSDRLNRQQRRMWETTAQTLGLRMEYVGKIVAGRINGIDHEANASHADGVVSRSITSERSFVEDTLEEALHRLGEIGTPEYNVLVDALYKHSEDRNVKAGEHYAFGEEKAGYDRIGRRLSTKGYVEEVSATEIGKIFRSEAEYNRWYNRVMTNEHLKSAWQKLADIIGELIEKVNRFIDSVGLSKDEKAKLKKDFDEVDRIRGLLAEALKATEDEFHYRRNDVQSKNLQTNSDKNLEIKTKKEYNGNTMHSLKDDASGNANIETIKKLILSINGRRGLKYDGGRVIRIPNNDMETLRHKFMTEHHYSNRSGGIIDCIDSFGQGGEKHYFYIFYVGEDNRVAPFFRLDYEYIERYIADVQKISKEMGYMEDEFIGATSGDGKGIDRIRNLSKGDSVHDVSTTGKETNSRSGKIYNDEGGSRATDNGFSNYGIPDRFNKESINVETGENTSYSLKVKNQKTLDFLENQEHITTYKAMQLIDGKLYPPMAAKTKGADGKYRLTNPSEIGSWQRAVEDTTNIKFNAKGVGYYVLNKGDGTSVTAAYNPYEHSSNLVLNDQFEGAYHRDNLVTVECVIPKSEMTSGYKAQYAKDATGVLDWKSGVVAGKIKNNKRKVYLSRWLKPVRILSDAETARMYKEALGDSNVAVPFNVVTPSLLSELEKLGVPIDYEGSPMYKSNKERNKEKNGVAYSLKDSEYLELAKNPEQNEAKLQAMVDEAAKRAGYTKKVYHGTNQFGFTQVETTGVEEGVGWSPFFASDSVETSGTYSVISKERHINEEYEGDSVAEDAIEEIDSEIDDAIGEFCSKISRYFSEWFFGYDGGLTYVRNIVGDFDNDIYEYLTDIVADAYSQYGEEYHEKYEDFVDWQEDSEDWKKIETSIIDIESLVNKKSKVYGLYETSGIYGLYANTDGFFEMDCKGNYWNALEDTRLPDKMIASGFVADDGKEFQSYVSVLNYLVDKANELMIEEYGDGWTLEYKDTKTVETDGVFTVYNKDFELGTLTKKMRKVKYKTRDVALWAKDNGYKGVIFKNIVDNGVFGRAKSSNVYTFFNPQEQIKSADPVTYDKDENIVPLSERFSKEKKDIRYSLKEDTSKLSAEEQKSVNALGEGAKVATNKNGNMLIATNKNRSTVMYSLKTYQNGGKEALKEALIANGHTEAEINETLALVDDASDYLTILAAGYAKSHNYTALSNHLIADVITNVKTGKQIISSIVNNGDYPVNIDLALICKKRVAYMNLMNRLIDDGIFDKVNYGGEAIAKVNDLLRTDGFETACLGCFVESRRLQFQTWAETIVSEWNAEVDKRKNNADNFNFADGKAKLTDAEMDALAEELKNAGNKNAQGNLNLGQGSVQTRMGRLLDKVPSLQKHLTVADLLKPEGLTALRAYDSNLFSLVKSRYGAASPKIVQDYNPYASEIAMMTFSSVKNITSNAVKGADAYRRKVINEMGGNPVKQKGETNEAFKARKAEFNARVEDEAIRRYLYDIGGARIQSFSDFMIENVFDYIQIFADLSAKRLPLHGYTKEIVALRLFGMTGAKWNGSWIAHVDRNMGKEYAGLLPASEAKDGSAILVHTEDGDFAIGFDDYARYKATNKKSFIQSIGMKDMIALQLDPRYSPYVGSITIGVSDKQILAMLDSPLFRFVIPYHASGMLPQFAKLVGVDLYNDYTDYQNTTVKKWFDAYGNPCNPIKDSKGDTLKVDTSYNFNAEVQKTGDAKKAATNYLKWCDQKHPVYDKKKLVGYVTFSPKFSNSPYGTDFSKHENYYKMLEDFNSYDNITEKSAVQGAVTMNFPSEQNRLTASEMEAYQERLRETGIFSEKEIEKYSEIANKTFKELIADEVKGRAEYQKAQSPKWENTVKNVEQMLLADHKRESYSLKGGKRTTSLREDAKVAVAVDDLEKGKKGAEKRLAKYVDSGAISTEAYSSLVKKYGAIPAGENPHREIQVPQKTSKDKKVSQTVRTILEAKVTPDITVPTIEKMVEDGVFSYEVYTDKQAIKDQEDYLREYGWTESLNDWLKDVNEGIVSKQHTVMGWALYNNAVNRATETTDESVRNDAMKTALNVLDAMVRHQRSAAQALQATRMLKKMSPEAQLYGIQKSVSAFQNELSTKYGKKAPDLKIDEELAEQFLNAETQEERDTAMANIYKDIGRQMPSDWLDRWNAWRYLAMLGNPRTHIRNIAGNAFFAPVVATKNLTATAIESVVYRVSGKKMLRGKALVSGSKADRKLLKAAWNDYANVADIVSNGGKYNDSAVASQSVEDGRKILNNWQPKKKFLKPIATVSNAVATPLEVARKANSKALEKEDVWFSKPHYAYALAQYCKANNITAEQIERGMAIAPARDYAIKEAQKATYKDTNGFSQLVSELGRNGNKKSKLKNAFGGIIEGVLPFRKTPANILVRGFEYSPLGLLKSLSVDLVKVGKGDMKAYEAIDNISAGLTGTGLVALGVFLAAQGLVRGHGEDEEEERKFKEMMGHQAYSLELPNGTSVTLDWLAPEALPFFVGVNIWEAADGQKEDVTLARIISSVTSISDPMLNMSFLQGINDLFESVGYASSNDTSALVAVLASAVTSYLTQGIPTLFGQIERTGEENRMTTYTEKNDFLTGDVQYTLGKASAKIPFWDYNQIPYIDAWGRKEASEVALTRGLNNFLNPAYTSNIETSNMEKELLRLYEKTGEGGVFPSRADKYFVVDGKRMDLTANNYVKYATLKGQKSYKLVSDLVKSKAYKQLDDAEKVKAIKEAYDYANQKAKQAVNSKYEPDNWVTKADEFGSGVGNYFSFRSEVSNTRNENGGKISKQEVVDIVLDMAQNDSEIWNMYLSEYDSSSASYVHDNGVSGEDYMNFLDALDKYDKPNKNGKYGTYTNEEYETAIRSIKGLSRQEKAILWQSKNPNGSTKNNPWR